MLLTRRFVLTLLAIATLALGGCERVSERTGDGATQLVTADFGTTLLAEGPVSDKGSVLDALRATGPVETAFGGGFVTAFGERRSDRAGQRDWFYYVNGVSAGRGADQERLRTGDVVWWDYRPWGGLMDAWAVVGSWPEPFVHGYPDTPESVSADPPLDDPLRAAGAPVGAADSPWRVRVGDDATLRRRDAAWKAAMDDPAAAGLAVRIDAGRILALDANGTTSTPVAGGRALAAAVLTGASPGDGGVLFVVAGLDGAAARASARRIADDPDVLRGRFAVVFDGDGVPVRAAGRVGP